MPQSGKDIRRVAYRKLMVFGILQGHRINSVNLDAVGWMVHLISGADDFGNLYADPYLCLSQCAPRRREITEEQINQLNQALAGTTDRKGNPSPLIRFYEAEDGERYIHLVGFTAIQRHPNGRPVRKHPPCQFEADDQAIGLADVNRSKPGAAKESGADQGDPGNPNPDTPQPEPPPEQKPEPEPPRRGADEAAHATQTPPGGSALGGADGSGHGGGQARGGGTGGNGCLMKLNNEAALSMLGIKGGILGQLCRMEGLTPQIIEETHAAVVAPGTARNVTSCLIKRLKDPAKWVGA